MSTADQLAVLALACSTLLFAIAVLTALVYLHRKVDREINEMEARLQDMKATLMARRRA